MAKKHTKQPKKRVYEPGEKIIITSTPPGSVGWVVEDHRGSTGLYGDGKWMVRVARHEEDAKEHRFKLVSYDHVLPYTDTLWMAFERLQAMGEELNELYRQLCKGIIPLKLTAVVQGDLFDKENTDAMVE